MTSFAGMMACAQYEENSPDITTVQLNDIPKPTASPNCALVRIRAAAVNPIDDKVMKGYLKGVWNMPSPMNVGYDMAGTIESLGANDSSFSVGDKVFAVNWGQGSHDCGDSITGGCLAEYINIPLSKLSKIPEGLSFEQAAALALVGTTAYQILFDCAKITAASKVLILGGSSSVGSLAIQLAKFKGAWVATTCSARNVEYVQQFGPDLIINYATEKWEEVDWVRGVDAIIDTVGETDGFARSAGVVKADGAFVSISSPDAGYVPTAHPPLSYAAFHCLSNNPNVQDELASLVAHGTLKVVINKTFPFTAEGVHGALQAVAGGKSNGKNVVVMGTGE